MDTDETDGHSENSGGPAAKNRLVKSLNRIVQALKTRLVEWLTLFVLAAGVAVAVVTLQSIKRQVEIAGQQIEIARQQIEVAGHSAAAAEKAANAAITAADAAESQIEIARQQIEDGRDALRLDQRAWLGYGGYAIQARANDTSEWENREPGDEEQFRGRFQIQNVGKTPALNVRLMNGEQIPLIPVDDNDPPAEPKKWLEVLGTRVVFPDTDGADGFVIHNTGTIRLDELFEPYSNRKTKVFFWLKLYYCDTTGHRHWTQNGVAHLHGASNFQILASSVSPDPGEPNHPDCQSRERVPSSSETLNP